MRFAMLYYRYKKRVLDHVIKYSSRIDLLNDENEFIYLLISSGSIIKSVAHFY